MQKFLLLTISLAWFVTDAVAMEEKDGLSGIDIPAGKIRMRFGGVVDTAKFDGSEFFIVKNGEGRSIKTDLTSQHVLVALGKSSLIFDYNPFSEKMTLGGRLLGGVTALMRDDPEVIQAKDNFRRLCPGGAPATREQWAAYLQYFSAQSCYLGKLVSGGGRIHREDLPYVPKIHEEMAKAWATLVRGGW